MAWGLAGLSDAPSRDLGPGAHAHVEEGDFEVALLSIEDGRLQLAASCDLALGLMCLMGLVGLMRLVGLLNLGGLAMARWPGALSPEFKFY